MKIGFIGLGQMGHGMIGRLALNNIEVVGYDKDSSSQADLISAGMTAATSYEELLEELGSTPIIWLMLPVSEVQEAIDKLGELMRTGGIILDGSNSDFRDSIKRAQDLIQHNIRYVDVGVGGGVLGEQNGYCLMVGSDSVSIEFVRPILDALSEQNSWAHVGPVGSGHFVKIAHNAIEYGVLEAYAEGYRLMKEAAPAELNLIQVGTLWQNRSIISSEANKAILRAMEAHPNMEEVSGEIDESGPTRIAMEYAESQKIEMPVIRTSLEVRTASKHGNTNYATRLISAVRNVFGGHAVRIEKK